MSVKRAVIPCAGLGTRFLPVTKVVAKELLPIVDTPALSYIVQEAIDSGIEEILIVISSRKRYIKRLFRQDKVLNRVLKAQHKQDELDKISALPRVKIRYALQRKMNGNGKAIALAKRFTKGEPFAVLFGDDVMRTDGSQVTKQLIDAYEKTKMCVVGCQRTSEEVARMCGVMVADKPVDDKITLISGIVEKPSGELPSELVSLGRFVLTSDIFDAIKRTKRTDGEVYLTDAISLLASEKGACACLFDAKRYDIGNKLGYLEAVTEFALSDDKLSDGFRAYLEGLLKKE